MRLKQLTIENYRAHALTHIEFDELTCFIGANGAGKSCVFSALNILFRQPTTKDSTGLKIEDFHNRNTAKPISISATFENLSDNAKEDLKHYVRQNKLTLTARATWDEQTRTAPIRSLGSRRIIGAFAPMFVKAIDKTAIKEFREASQAYALSIQTCPTSRKRPRS